MQTSETHMIGWRARDPSGTAEHFRTWMRPG